MTNEVYTTTKPNQNNPPAPAPLPVIACIVCGQTMHAIFQPSMMPGRDGYFLVTCETETCPMKGYTLAANNYPPDLTLYLAPKVEYADDRLDIDIAGLAKLPTSDVLTFLDWLFEQYGILEVWDNCADRAMS